MYTNNVVNIPLILCCVMYEKCYVMFRGHRSERFKESIMKNRFETCTQAYRHIQGQPRVFKKACIDSVGRGYLQSAGKMKADYLCKSK